MSTLNGRKSLEQRNDFGKSFYCNRLPNNGFFFCLPLTTLGYPLLGGYSVFKYQKERKNPTVWNSYRFFHLAGYGCLSMRVIFRFSILLKEQQDKAQCTEQYHFVRKIKIAIR